MDEQESKTPVYTYFGPWDAKRNALIPEYKRAIVEGIASGLWVSEIALRLQISTTTIGRWRDEDKDFDKQYRDATEHFVDTLDREVHRRAFEGVTDVVVHAGKVVMDPLTPEGEAPRPLLRRQYSDGLAMFILKGRRREVYGDRVETDNKHTVNLDGARESLAAKLTALAERQRPSDADRQSDQRGGDGSPVQLDLLGEAGAASA